MNTTIYHPYIKQGSDWVFDGVCLNVDGTRFDLTGWTGRSQLRDTASSTIVIASLIVAPVAPIATSGILRVSLLATASREIPLTGRTFAELRSFAWDVYLVNDISGQEVCAFNGIAKMSPQVSKPTTP